MRSAGRERDQACDPRIARDRRKTPSMVWMCSDCGKRGTVFDAEILSRLEYQGARGFYLLTRRAN